jgi:allantoicase
LTKVVPYQECGSFSRRHHPADLKVKKDYIHIFLLLMDSGGTSRVRRYGGKNERKKTRKKDLDRLRFIGFIAFYLRAWVERARR